MTISTPTAEQALLGALLLDHENVAGHVGHLREQDFEEPSHRLIFRAARDLLASGVALDLVTIREALKGLGKLDQAGGSAYLAELAQCTTSTAHAKSHAGIVLRTSQAHALQGIGRRLAGEAETISKADPVAFDDWAQSQTADLFGVLAERGAGQALPIGSAVVDLIEACRARQPVRRIPTGIEVLDEGPLCGGFAPGTLNLIAARASTGKTTAALRIARTAAQAGPVLFLSLETSCRLIAVRLLAAEAGIDSRDLQAHALDGGQEARAEQAGWALRGVPIHVQDPPRISIEGVRMAALSFVRRHPDTSLIVLDHAGKVGSDAGTAYERASLVSNGLQSIARELDGPPLLVLCQLNRAIESRGAEAWPIMSDLRDSGAYEQDADTMLFLRRETATDGRPSGRLGLSIGKNRDGAAGGRWWLDMDWARYAIRGAVAA